MSTGMPIKEVITQAIAHAEGTGASAMQNKRVYYELPLETLLAGASKENYQKKEVVYVPPSTESLDSVSIVAGGVSGTPLTAVVDLKSENLVSEYGYSAKEATNIEGFLHSVSVKDGISTTDFEPIQEMLFSHLSQQSRSEVLEKDMLALFDSSAHASYNLTNVIGFAAYVGTNRFKSSSLTKADLEQIVSFDSGSTKRASTQDLRESCNKTTVCKFKCSGKR